MSSTGPWLSIRAAANHAGHHYSTIWRKTNAGEIHGHQRYDGASWRIHVASLEAWLRGEPDTAASCSCTQPAHPSAC